MTVDAWTPAVPAWVGRCCSQTSAATCPCGHARACHYYAGCHHCPCAAAWVTP